MSKLDSIAVQSPDLPQSTKPQALWSIERGEDGLVVLRGAHQPEPDPIDWRDRLAWFIRHLPGIQMVGCKRLSPEGNVFSMGEFVIHPKGFHHHGRGVQGECYRFPEPCDTIAGGVALVEAHAFDEVDGVGLLEKLGPLGMLGLGLALRQQGGGVLACPQAAVTDALTPFVNDNTSRAAFLDHFGFDWVAPDLSKVREQHAGGGLLWNASLHAGMMPFEKYDERGGLCWEGYKTTEVFRKRAHSLTGVVAQHTLKPHGLGEKVIDVGSGDGLFTHLFAHAGCTAIGIDPEPTGVATATDMVAQHSYPEQSGGRPEFRVGNAYEIPFENEFAGCATLFDVIEHLDNPIAALNEISRVLKPGGHFICVTPAWQFGASSDPVYHGFEFTEEELLRLINAADGMEVVNTGKIGGVYRDLIAIAQKQA